MPVVYKPRAYALEYPELFRTNRAWSVAELRRAGVAERDVRPLCRMLAQSRRLLRKLRAVLKESAI